LDLVEIESPDCTNLGGEDVGIAGVTLWHPMICELPSHALAFSERIQESSSSARGQQASDSGYQRVIQMKGGCGS
jgi:hypothetical protein